MSNTNRNETLLLERASKSETPPMANAQPKRRAMRFDDYEVGGFYDEMFARTGEPRAIARRLLASFKALPEGELLNRQQAAERELLQLGITLMSMASKPVWRKSYRSTSCRGSSLRTNGRESNAGSSSASRR